DDPIDPEPDYCDDPGNWDECYGDGGDDYYPDPDAPSESEIKNAIADKPFALLPDIPCETIRQWLATATHEVQQAQLDKLDQIVSTSTSYPGMTTTTVARLQHINDAYSSVVNMDYFPVTVNELPVVNGQRQTPEQFLNHIRTNINSFVDTEYSEFEPYQWPGLDEITLWNSSNPLGAVIGIDIKGPDNGSVIVSDYDTDKWTFSTIFDPKYGEHPVSGNRDFGYTQNDDGSYTFYTRGVDRLTSWDGEWARKNLDNFPFNQADALWTSFQNKINNYVNQHEGNASVANQQIHRPDWQQVVDVLNGQAPLSTLSKDCPD
ncbi:hypothetical protein, partial [Sinomicrobium soli]|uniref:hypothetical protein n=1 Tax=Sinomicrobium sp. N-1-3-6 TaxID=2219864 RepID=UPI000DCB569E